MNRGRRGRVPFEQLSPKTRAILKSIEDVDRTANEIGEYLGLPAIEVHPRIQNCVRSGYAVISRTVQVRGIKTANKYRAAKEAIAEQEKAFPIIAGYDCRELLAIMSPSKSLLPEGTRRVVAGVMTKHHKDDEVPA